MTNYYSYKQIEEIANEYFEKRRRQSAEEQDQES